MLKYAEVLQGFAEVPDEITLCINISNCPCYCKSCHSPHLANDIGYYITHAQLDSMILNAKGITCVCFMGGDSEPDQVNFWANYIRKNYDIKVGWYSGRQKLSKDIDLNNFDFIKLGPYEENKGPLNKRTTNQKFYKVEHSDGKCNLVDITYRFWKEND